MLGRVEKAVAVLSWVAAAALVLMLFIGPQVIAEDEAKPKSEAAGAAPYSADGSGSGSGSGADGKVLFVERCGSCHTLEAAGTSGQVGPRLDDTSLAAAEVAEVVRDGRGGMPAFGDQLSNTEISAVASYVVKPD